MTRNGMAIVEVTDTQQKAVFIDEDTLEAARLTAMVNRNREAKEAERKKAEREQRIIDKQRKRWEEYTFNTFYYIGVRCVLICGCVWSMLAGLMNPVISIPVMAYCLATAGIRFGVWYGSKR